MNEIFQKCISLFLCIFSCCFSFAQQQNNELLRKIHSLPKDTSSIKPLLKYSQQLGKQSPDTAILWVKEALKRSTAFHYDKGMAESFLVLGNLYEDKSDFTSALNFYHQSLLINKELNDSIKIASAYNNIGLIYSQQGKLDSAFYYIKYALRLYEKMKDDRGMANDFTNIGALYYSTGNYPEALAYYFKALKIAERLKDRKSMANLFNNIGIIHDIQQNYDAALEYYFKALDLKKELNDNVGMISTYSNISIVYQLRRDYSYALSYSFKALSLQKTIGDSIGLGNSHNSIGAIYLEQKQYDSAYYNIAKSIGLLKAKNAKVDLHFSLVNMGQWAIEQNKNRDAIRYLSEALNIAEETGVQENRTMLYELLAKAYSQLNDYKTASNYLKLIISTNDSLFNKEKTRQFAEMETIYDTEKKEKQIELLNKEKELQLAEGKRVIFQRNAWISGAISLTLLGILIIFYINSRRSKEKITMEKQMVELEQKAILLQMNPHFIFNCLNVIHTFIAEKNVVSAKNYLSKFAKLMRFLLENSRESVITLEAEIKTIKLYLEFMSLLVENKFDYSIHIDPAIDTNTFAIPPMLIQPYLENAILHGIATKEGEGKIEIHFFVQDNFCECTITDNGIGREKAKEISRKNDPDHQSTGMRITQERLTGVGRLYGIEPSLSIVDMEDEQKNSAGTKVKFNIPLEKVWI